VDLCEQPRGLSRAELCTDLSAPDASGFRLGGLAKVHIGVGFTTSEVLGFFEFPWAATALDDKSTNSRLCASQSRFPRKSPQDFCRSWSFRRASRVHQADVRLSARAEAAARGPSITKVHRISAGRGLSVGCRGCAKPTCGFSESRSGREGRPFHRKSPQRSGNQMLFYDGLDGSRRSRGAGPHEGRR
jgi:hypothetical protein